MDNLAALRSAIKLIHVPSQVATLRKNPLPHGMLLLLQVASGDPAAEPDVATLEGQSPGSMQAAASFFIEQILLHPDADSYRVLGVTTHTSPAEARRHMALMVRWLHPDLDPDQTRARMAPRVTQAWDDIKTNERREVYDQHMRALPSAGGRVRISSHSQEDPRRRRLEALRAQSVAILSRAEHQSRRPAATAGRLGFWRRALRLLTGARRI